MVQRKFQLSRMVIVIVVAPLNLYKTEPGATLVWIDMHIFQISLQSLLFLLNPPFEQIYYPRLLYVLITWPQKVVLIWLVITSSIGILLSYELTALAIKYTLIASDLLVFYYCTLYTLYTLLVWVIKRIEFKYFWADFF